MINLTKMNGDGFFLNSSLIETMEQMPDHTVIFLIDGKTLIAQEQASQIRMRCIEYAQAIHRGPIVLRGMDKDRGEH